MPGVNDAWFGFYSHFKKGTLHVHMNNFKISRQKYSTNMATGRYVTSRASLRVILVLFKSPFLGCREFRHLGCQLERCHRYICRID